MFISKKIFIISAIALGVVLIFLGIYNFAFKTDSSRTYKVPASTNNFASNSSASPQKEEKAKSEDKIHLILDEPVISPSFIQDKKTIEYYSPNDKGFFSFDTGSKAKSKIADEEIAGLKKVIWSPAGDEAILKVSKDGKDSLVFYNLADKAKKELNSGVEYVVWTNWGDKIIYKYFDSASNKKTVNIADPDGSNWKKLADVAWRNVSLAQIPSSSLVSFWNSPNAYEDTALETVGIAGGEINKIFSGRFGADYLWSPNGEKVLISSSDSKGGSKMFLGVANKNGGEYQNLNTFTLVSKCVWDKDNVNIYCALPNSIPNGSVMPNDYQEKKFTTIDTFWKINVANGKKDRIAELSDIKSDYDAANLFLSSGEDTLFFVNRIDGKLYGISL
jgi:hypothetical protein